MKRSARLWLLALAACSPKPVAPELPEPTEQSEPPLPLWDAIRHGEFDNGLSWFVVPNDKPQDRAELRLVVDAGSVLEEEDQLGLAHFVEHMAFNGTEHFEGNELITYLESIGTRFGAHLNASTGFDTTQYMLRVPTDDPELLARGLLVLEDWAQGLSFDPEEIERERGVVLEEWRTREGAQQRITDRILPAQFHGSRYVDRLPIGTRESLEGFEHEALRRFYDSWYRPDLMAVVAVGDFEPAAVQELIAQHFEELPPAEDPPEREEYGLPEHDPLVVVVPDPEIPSTTVRVLSKRPAPPDETRSDYRDSLVRHLCTAILNERLASIARQPDAPFLGAGAGRTPLSRTTHADVISAQAREGEALRALEAVWTEVRRMQEFGVTAGELERARAAMLRSYQSSYDQRDTRTSASIAAELIRHITTGEPVPGIKTELAIAQEELPDIGPEELAPAAATFLASRSRVSTLLLPEKEGIAPPSVAEVEAVFAAVEEQHLHAPADEVVDGPIIASLPEPGKIVSRARLEPIETEKWTLSNGVEVYVRPTDFSADRVRFRAFSPGGHAALPLESYVPALTATSIARRSGLGDFDAGALAKRLAGVQASSQVLLGAHTAGFRGGAARDDLESALQLLYLQATAPRFDEVGFRLELENRRQRLRNRLLNPTARMGDAYTALMWPEAPRHEPWTEQTLEQMDLEESERIYRERFADLSDLTVFIVGDFDPEELEGLVERYLATLPGGAREAGYGDHGERRGQGLRQDVVYAGTADKARYRRTIHGELAEGPEADAQVRALARILSVQLREELREELGGVYGVSVRPWTTIVPVREYGIDIQFQCDPERLEELREATLATLADLRSAPLPEQYVANEQEKTRRSLEESRETNGWWLSLLEQATLRGLDPVAASTVVEEVNESLSGRWVQEAALRWLHDEHVVELRLLPE